MIASLKQDGVDDVVLEGHSEKAFDLEGAYRHVMVSLFSSSRSPFPALFFILLFPFHLPSVCLELFIRMRIIRFQLCATPSDPEAVSGPRSSEHVLGALTILVYPFALHGKYARPLYDGNKSCFACRAFLFRGSPRPSPVFSGGGVSSSAKLFVQ